MIQVVWEFIVKESAVRRFIRAYGPGGPWERLFRGHAGFLGTALLRDADNARRFMTIDSWETGAQRKRMLTTARDQYVHLDELLADLTEGEHEIGIFRLLTDTPVYSVGTAHRGKSPGARRRSR